MPAHKAYTGAGTDHQGASTRYGTAWRLGEDGRLLRCLPGSPSCRLFGEQLVLETLRGPLQLKPITPKVYEPHVHTQAFSLHRSGLSCCRTITHFSPVPNCSSIPLPSFPPASPSSSLNPPKRSHHGGSQVLHAFLKRSGDSQKEDG